MSAYTSQTWQSGGNNVSQSPSTINLTDGLTGYEDGGKVTVSIKDGAVSSAKMDTSVIQSRVVALSSANIKGMYGNSVELVPGVAGKTIVLEDVAIAFTPGATAYTGGGAIMVGTADKDLITAIPAALILSTAVGEPLVSYAKGLNISVTEGQGLPVLITNASAAFATGTTAATVTVRYHLV
jgi:hypothetical protein